MNRKIKKKNTECSTFKAFQTAIRFGPLLRSFPNEGVSVERFTLWYVFLPCSPGHKSAPGLAENK